MCLVIYKNWITSSRYKILHSRGFVKSSPCEPDWWLWQHLVLPPVFYGAVLLLEGLIVFFKRDISNLAQQILCNKNVTVYILCVSWMFLDRMPVLVKACWCEWLGTILWGVTAGMNSYLKLTWNRKSCCCIVLCQRERIILSLEGILL